MESWDAQVFLGHTLACYVVVQGSLVPPGQVPPWGNMPLNVGFCAVAGWLVVAPKCSGDAQHQGLLWGWRCLTWKANRMCHFLNAKKKKGILDGVTGLCVIGAEMTTEREMV